MASDAYTNGDKNTVKDALNRVAYMALVVKEMQLAKRAYNLLGHSYISWKQYKPAMESFKKLKDCSSMEKDMETTMYAFKQIGFCY